MFDWDRFRVGSLAIELNDKFEVYEFLKIAQNQGFELMVNDFEAYVGAMHNGFKYFWLNSFREIAVSDNEDRFDYVVKYSDVFSDIFPSKESLMEFLNGE